MIKWQVNGVDFFTKSGLSILEGCESIGIDIPRFCYHSSLSIAGNCRMCLVELQNSPKPVAACAFPIVSGMQIFTNSPLIKKARENVLETLLLNHPLDCPICDQGGECDLQDQAKTFGKTTTRFFVTKRSVIDKQVNLFIKTIMTRCIHCTRCVRFNAEVSKNEFFGTLGRGIHTEIGSYADSSYVSTISANVIDLCPVGALTSKQYAFKTRPWELRSIESIDLTDGFGSKIYISLKESGIVRIFPKVTKAGSQFISDRARFCYDANKLNRCVLRLPKVQKVVGGCNLILCNSSLDFENLQFIKSIETQTKKSTSTKLQFKARSIQGPSFLKNYFFFKNEQTFSKEYSSKFYLLLAANINIEHTALNLYLNNKLIQENLEIYGFKTNKIKPTELTSISINLFNIFLILEGKNISISRCLINKKNPVVILSSVCTTTRGLNLELLDLFFKKTNSDIKTVLTSFTPNSTSLKVLHFNKVTAKDLLITQQLIAVDLEDSYLLSKNLFILNKAIVWLNTHKSILSNTLQNSTLSIFPTLTAFEEEKFFINTHNRVQKTLISVNPPLGSYTVRKQLYTYLLRPFFKHSSYNQLRIRYSRQFNFLKESSKNSSNNTPVNQLAEFILKQQYNICSLSVYPNKVLIEDPFLVNGLTKNSRILYSASTLYRQSQHLFIN